MLLYDMLVRGYQSEVHHQLEGRSDDTSDLLDYGDRGYRNSCRSESVSHEV